MLFACDLKLWPQADSGVDVEVSVERYDRLQSRYLLNGDFSALQKMNTSYPIETRTLIENVLQLGAVNDPMINKRFLAFYQDTTLQQIIRDVESQYEDVSDINSQLTFSLNHLHQLLPNIQIPVIYTQIGALSQSIVIGDNTIGISLDKYLGKDYPIYERYYPKHQRESMTRQNIVPDCLLFYILSNYPLQNFETRSQKERDTHIGRVMYVANKAMGQDYFKRPEVTAVAEMMEKNPNTTCEQLLK